MGSPVFWFRATGPTVCVVNQEKKCRGPAGLRLGRKKPPVGCFRMWSSSKPFTVAAIAPGRYRGCGRNPLACIHTQREPSFSPLGAATNTVIPEGFPDVWPLKQASGNPSSTAEIPEKRERVWCVRGQVALCLAAGAERSTHCLVEGVVRGDSRMGAGWSHVITKGVTWLLGSERLRMLGRCCYVCAA